MTTRRLERFLDTLGRMFVREHVTDDGTRVIVAVDASGVPMGVPWVVIEVAEPVVSQRPEAGRIVNRGDGQMPHADRYPTHAGRHPVRSGR